jgi:hypothetical protein
MIKIRSKTADERKRDEAPKVSIVVASSLNKCYDHFICDRCRVSFSGEDEIAVIERTDGYTDTRCPRMRGIFWKKRCLYSLTHADQDQFDRYYVALTFEKR